MSDYASVAAHLAATNHKNVQTYEPQSSQNARSAAAHARPKSVHLQSGHKPDSLSTASSKAAMLAHLRRPQSQDGDALSKFAPEEGTNGPKWGLLAATKSFNEQKAPEAKPINTPLGARETIAAQRRINARRQESSSRHSGQIIKIAPEMLTEHPPIRMERDEKRHRDALHASAVSLAKQTFARQQANSRPSASDSTTAAMRASAQSRPKRDIPTIQQKPMQYSSLQDTAQKMANERLAKIQDANGPSEYRNYYGYPQVQRSKSHRLVSKVRGNRRRSGSDPDDVAQSQRIKSQMSILRAQISQVDADQQDQDRQRLLEVARKKVHADMHKMDQAVYKETGKMSPAMMHDWDEKARSRLREKRELPEAKPDDAVDIGGGKRLDRSEIDTLAVSRVKPTLEGINEAVAKKRAEDEAARAREEERKREAREEKEQKKEEKAEKKRTHDEEKAVKHHLYEEQKAEKKRVHEEQKAEKKRIREEQKAEKLQAKEESKSSKIPKAEIVAALETRPQAAQTDLESLEFSTPKQSIESGAHPIESASIQTPEPTPDRRMENSADDSPSSSKENRRSSVWSRLNRHSIIGASSSDHRSSNEQRENNDQSVSNDTRADSSAMVSDSDAHQDLASRKKQPIWKRISLTRTKSSDADSPGRFPHFKKLGSRKTSTDDEGRHGFHVALPATHNKLTKEPHGSRSDDARPTVSAPVKDLIQKLTPVPSGEALRAQDDRNDRLAGLHVDSKFHEDIR